jgi:hypothetical protein
VIITCPRCFNADWVSYVKAPEAGFIYTCTNDGNHDPVGDYQWIADPHDSSVAFEGWSDSGVTADLLDPLAQIVRELPHVWLEYGVIEYELRKQYPSLFGQHVGERGHVIIAPKQPTASSVRFAAALVRLERAGVIRSRPGPATGAWSYNHQISHWILEPVQDSAGALSWQERCVALGRPPEWTDDDRDEVRRLAGLPAV